MNLYESIYRDRSRYEDALQPSCATLTAEIRGALSDMGLRHPYSLSNGQLCSLLKLCALGHGSIGPAAISFQGSELYRIVPVKSLLLDPGLAWKAHLSTFKGDFESWNSLRQHYLKANRWLDLKTYATGRLLGRRMFGWWTTEPALAEEPLRTAYRLGMTNDDIAENALVLRCRDVQRLHRLKMLRRPTPLDGHLSIFFLARGKSAHRGCGKTLDLTDAGVLPSGLPEYAVSPIPVELIQMIPIEIKPAEKAKAPVDLTPALLQKLLTLYRDLNSQQ